MNKLREACTGSHERRGRKAEDKPDDKVLLYGHYPLLLLAPKLMQGSETVLAGEAKIFV